MKISTIFIFLATLLPIQILAQNSKNVSVGRVLDSVHAVYEIARKSSQTNTTISDTQLEESLDAVIKNCTPTELGQIAVLCYTIAYPGDAGDVDFDKPFDRACWRCILRLSKQPTKESQNALSFIERHARFDGGDKMAFDELMERLRNSKPAVNGDQKRQ